MLLIIPCSQGLFPAPNLLCPHFQMSIGNFQVPAASWFQLKNFNDLNLHSAILVIKLSSLPKKKKKISLHLYGTQKKHNKYLQKEGRSSRRNCFTNITTHKVLLRNGEGGRSDCKKSNLCNITQQITVKSNSNSIFCPYLPFSTSYFLIKVYQFKNQTLVPSKSSLAPAPESAFCPRFVYTNHVTASGLNIPHHTICAIFFSW